MKPPYHEEGEFISPIFVTPKSDGGYRLILNLKSLNEYIDIEHFKMHGLKEILKLVERNCYMAALDIKDLYYSIPVEESFQKKPEICLERNTISILCTTEWTFTMS